MVEWLSSIFSALSESAFRHVELGVRGREESGPWSTCDKANLSGASRTSCTALTSTVS